MTPFAYEHVFRAPSATVILASYFDVDHLAAQDAVGGLVDRTVIEHHDDGASLRCSWRVWAKRQLPLFVRPFVEGGRLRYVEAMMWRRADEAIDLTVTPEILGGRVQIAAVYQITKVGEGQFRRRYAGNVTVNIKLLSSRIERGIVDAIEEGMPAMTGCTQAWLDRAHPVTATAG